MTYYLSAMTITQKMLSAATNAVALFGENRVDETREFYRRLVTDEGGFAGRDGRTDLYYTVFGLLGCRALNAPVPLPAVRTYLASFALGEKLDTIHVSCLARWWAILGDEGRPPGLAKTLRKRIEACRSADGGYAQQPGMESGSAYGCFLAMGTYEDLGADLPNPAGVAACLRALAVGDGSYANDAMMPICSLPATAAAAVVLGRIGLEKGDRHLRGPNNRPAAEPVPVFERPAKTSDWLLSQHDPNGGLRAVPLAPEPDLLSTAVAMLALRELGADLSGIRENCLRFVDSLYAGGGFGGHAADHSPDAEYTFYGLLAMGCLT